MSKKRLTLANPKKFTAAAFDDAVHDLNRLLVDMLSRNGKLIMRDRHTLPSAGAIAEFMQDHNDRVFRLVAAADHLAELAQQALERQVEKASKS